MNGEIRPKGKRESAKCWRLNSDTGGKTLTYLIILCICRERSENGRVEEEKKRRKEKKKKSAEVGWQNFKRGERDKMEPGRDGCSKTVRKAPQPESLKLLLRSRHLQRAVLAIHCMLLQFKPYPIGLPREIHSACEFLRPQQEQESFFFSMVGAGLMSLGHFVPL